MPLETQQAQQKEDTQRQFTKISLVILGVFLLLTTSLVLYVWLQNRQIDKIHQAINKETTTVRSLAEIEVLGRTASARLEEIQKILKNNSHYSILLERIAQKVPPGVVVTDLTVIGPDRVSLSGEADGYLVIAKFVKAVSLGEEGSIFKGVVVPEVKYDGQAGKARFVLDISLQEGALQE